MIRDSQTTGFRTRDTSVRNCYLSFALTTLLGFGIVSTMKAQQAQTGVPVFKITPVSSVVKFDVAASVAIEGKFDKWDASLYVYLHRTFDGRVRHQNRCCQCGHGKRHEKQQAERQRFF